MTSLFLGLVKEDIQQMLNRLNEVLDMFNRAWVLVTFISFMYLCVEPCDALDTSHAIQVDIGKGNNIKGCCNGKDRKTFSNQNKPGKDATKGEKEKTLTNEVNKERAKANEIQGKSSQTSFLCSSKGKAEAEDLIQQF